MSLIEELNFTREEVLSKLCERVYRDTFNIREDGEDPDFDIENRIRREMNEAIAKGISEAVRKLAGELVVPRIDEMIRGLVIQKTNSYGEKKGETTTFIEYLIAAADKYMTEEVNSSGQSVSESRSSSYDFKKAGTRVAYMIDKHLQFNIETAMKQALADANLSIAKGLNEAVRIKLNEVLQSVKVGVTVSK